MSKSYLDACTPPDLHRLPQYPTHAQVTLLTTGELRISEHRSRCTGCAWRRDHRCMNFELADEDGGQDVPSVAVEVWQRSDTSPDFNAAFPAAQYSGFLWYEALFQAPLGHAITAEHFARCSRVYRGRIKSYLLRDEREMSNYQRYHLERARDLRPPRPGLRGREEERCPTDTPRSSS